MRTTIPLALAALLLAPAAAVAADPSTPNGLYARGLPTFVVGTAGDDDADRRVRVQADLIRALIFPAAKIVEDTSIDLAKGRAGWPANPVLYGGPHVNRVIAKLAPSLPFRMEPGKLVLGEETFEGDEYRLIALVPGDASRPAFVLYAGCGTPGVGEINGVSHGPHPILVADRFGPLVAGTWVRDGEDRLTPRLGPRARRFPWRKCGAGILRLELDPKDEGEAAIDAAIRRGLDRAAKKLGVESPAGVTVYVYPDRGSKRTLTGKPGDGHADVLSGTLHVLPAAPAVLEDMVAHEATHVIGCRAWGPAATPLLGEGMAVWVAGAYAGTPLARWKPPAGFAVPGVRALLGATFRRLPEPTSYPLAGILFGILVSKAGAEKVKEHLLPATAASWEEACRAAGITAEAVEEQFREAVSAR